MQDRYEVPVNVVHPDNFAILNGCTFDMKPDDACYTEWLNNPYILAQRGPYATNGLPAAMVLRSNFSSPNFAGSAEDDDLFIFGGPIDFTGYFPGWDEAAVVSHKYWSWYTLKAHTRNNAGTVQLQSTNPLQQPLINFNYFDTGYTEGGADQLDLDAMIQAVNLSRAALSQYYNYNILGGSSFTEVRPGPNVTTNEEIGDYIKNVAWGHHASCTCAIGNSSNPNAVLDSKFRVMG